MDDPDGPPAVTESCEAIGIRYTIHSILVAIARPQVLATVSIRRWESTLTGAWGAEAVRTRAAEGQSSTWGRPGSG